MKRLPFLMTALALVQGCTSARSGGESDASFAPQPLVSLSACVATYFDQSFRFSGNPAPRWTIGVMDRPEIAPAITDETGCADILLPARSRLLLTATKPGWVPNAMTVLTGNVALPSMQAQLLYGFSGLPPEWWYFTARSSCAPAPAASMDSGAEGQTEVAADGQTAIVGFALRAHDGAAIPDVFPILRPASGGERRDWLYVGAGNSSYCNSKYICPNCDCCQSTGNGVAANVAPGLAEIEFPNNLTCRVDPASCAFAWPKEGAPPNVFQVDARANYFTIVLAVCEPPGN
jgi:hypothetical protein